MAALEHQLHPQPIFVKAERRSCAEWPGSSLKMTISVLLASDPAHAYRAMSTVVISHMIQEILIVDQYVGAADRASIESFKS
jgi:hypothetical protein